LIIGSGDSIEGILALGGGKKCKSKEKAEEGKYFDWFNLMKLKYLKVMKNK